MRLKRWSFKLGWKGWRDHVALMGPSMQAPVETWDDATIRIRVELAEGGGDRDRARLMHVYVTLPEARSLHEALGKFIGDATPGGQ